MAIDAVSVAIGVIVGTTLCPWLLTLGSGKVATDERYERRNKLIEDTCAGFVTGLVACLPVVVIVSVLQGHNPL